MWRRLMLGVALLGAFHTAGAQVHGFDFLVGSWRVHHRVLRTDGTWLEFDGTCVNWSLMSGQANVEDHTFNKPSGVTHGVGLRAYDPKTEQWAIWWVDSRDPHLPMDPPVKGHFENGVGTFYSPARGLSGRRLRQPRRDGSKRRLVTMASHLTDRVRAG